MSTDAEISPHTIAPTPVKKTRPLYWSVRRELWENRSIWIAPLAVPALMLFGALINHLPGVRHSEGITVSTTRNVSVQTAPGQQTQTSLARAIELATPHLTPAQEAAKHAAKVALPYNIVALSMIATMFIVAVFYCLGAMHNERRDRSILFWKSLPVPDLTTVLAKVLLPMAVLPVVTILVTMVTELLMFSLSALPTATGAASPMSQIPIGEMTVVWLYGVAAMTLWWAPVYGWLMLVSGWARRGPFLWAVLPPIAVAITETLAFHTSKLGSLLYDRLMGGLGEAFVTPTGEQLKASGGYPIVNLGTLTPVKFLSSPDLWIGLLVAAAFWTATVWLRRDREPI